MNPSSNPIERALDDIKPGFTADNFDLRLDGVREDGTIDIVLEALPGACHDCLVPDEMLVKILEAGIREHQPGAGSVALRKQGF